MSDVLVTGGTGFIGSNLVLSLLDSGYDVRVFDNDFRGNEKNLEAVKDKIDFVKGDIRELSDVKRAVKGIETIYHLAYINGTENFYNKPDLVLDVGIKGTINVLDAAIEEKVDKFIYASSSEVYQTPKMIPTPEEVECIVPDVRNPRYSYGGGKILGELLTLHYAKNAAMKKAIFRPHNIYGPAMGWEHVIPQFIKKIYDVTDQFTKNEAQITIQGTGEETRAFCYIDDAVKGIRICAENGEDGGIYHVGKEEEISIIELLKLIAGILNIKIVTKPVSLTQGSTTRRCPDITKLKGLGYNPVVSLEEGLTKTINWYREKLINE